MKNNARTTLFSSMLVGLALFLSAEKAYSDDFMTDCAPKNISTWAKASFAMTGDSVIINNNRFQLIGIRAPQIQKKQKFYTRGQPLANEAQTELNKILANHNLEVGVEYDQRKTDDFNRGLVHLYVKEKDKIVSVERLMLESGYVLAQSSDPNYLHQKCYYAAEKKARDQGLALWKLVKDYPQLHFPIAISSQINTEDEGYHIYKGKIVLVEKGSQNYILNMDTTGIRIREADWNKFNFDQLKQLEGQTIEARGIGFLYKGAMFVKIESPNAIDKLNPVNQSSQ